MAGSHAQNSKVYVQISLFLKKVFSYLFLFFSPFQNLGACGSSLPASLQTWSYYLLAWNVLGNVFLLSNDFQFSWWHKSALWNVGGYVSLLSHAFDLFYRIFQDGNIINHYDYIKLAWNGFYVTFWILYSKWAIFEMFCTWAKLKFWTFRKHFLLFLFLILKFNFYFK